MSAIDVLSGRLPYHVENTEAFRFLCSLPDDSADALICDPPYSSGGLYRGDRAKTTTSKYVKTRTKDKRFAFGGDNRDQRSFFAWCTLWLSEALRVCKDGAPFAMFADWRQYPVASDAVQAGGWLWRGVITWDKTEGVRPQKGRPRTQSEFILWGSKGEMPLDRNAPVLPGAYRIPIAASERHHQTSKPVELLRNIARIVEPGGVILDPFMGSGSLGVAAALEGYRYIGCDISPEYTAIARERIRSAHASL